MAKEIIITIHPSAKVEIEAKGYTDSTCASDTKPFEDALSGKLERVKKEPSFNKKPLSTNAKTSGK